MINLLKIIFLFSMLTYSVGHAQQPQRLGKVLSPVTEGEERCIADSYFQQQMQADPGLEQLRAVQDRQIFEMTTGSSGHRAGNILSIPTVVHIIHNNGPENIPNTQVSDAIADLNKALRNQGYYDPNTGVDVEIELCLAMQDPGGNATDGINRVADPLTDYVLETQDLDLKNLSRWSTDHYLNIWVVNSITSQFSGAGVAGYATFPSSHGNPVDGIVVEHPFFGGSPDSTKLTVHEIGHYLGLYHVFQDGCMNNNCFQDGDRVCDTPPDASTANVPCTDQPNSCSSDEDDISTNNPFRPISMGGLGDQPDLFQDYMDYGRLACINVFTEGQKERMRLHLETIRASLLQGNRCLPACQQPIVASFTTSANPIFIGGTVFLGNTSTGATQYTWKINGQTFSSQASTSYFFPNQGVQTVTLLAENGSPECADSVSVDIEVECFAQASFTIPSGPVQPGQLVTFANTSSNANAYAWSVDGISAGTSPNLTYTFPTAGTYQIDLIATNGTCFDTSSVALQVGFCIDKTNAQWRFGIFAGLDFNNGAPVAITTSAMRAFESGATVSDANGDLLFYTNGGSISATSSYLGGIWNRNDSLMPNGALGVSDYGCTSAKQAALIIPHPGNSEQYYLFVMSCFEGNYNPGFAYHLIDMSMDNGMGDVAQKNQHIYNNRNESMAAVRHCNGRDYWIAILDDLDNSIQVFFVGPNGLDPNPRVSFQINTPYFNCLKFSPDGKKLAFLSATNSANKKIVLHDFDPSTGMITYREDIPFVVNAGGAFEFGSSGQYLFIMGADPSPNTWKLFQFDTDASPIAPTGTITSIPPLANVYPNSLQLAPDGKIYTSYPLAPALGMIQYPNQPQSPYIPAAVFLGSGVANYGLVNFPANNFHSPYPQIGGSSTVCQGNQVDYSLSYDSCGTNGILWEYRGGGSLIGTTDTTASIAFAQVGTDTLIGVNLANCSSLTDTLFITVGTGNPVDLGPNQYLCSGSASIDAGPGYASYQWNTNATTQSIMATTAGWYWVDVVDTAGCTERDSILILNSPGTPNPDLGSDTSICGNVLILDPGNGFNSYLWQDNSTDSTFTVFQGGTYVVEVTGPCGTVQTDTILVEACVGLGGLGLVSDINVYPNPNSGTFRIDAAFRDWQEMVDLEVWDVMGKQVWGEMIDQPGNSLEKEIRLPELSEGIYLFRVVGPSGSYAEPIWIR